MTSKCGKNKKVTHEAIAESTSFPGSHCLPLSVGERPLVAVGHVTTQNLGGKKKPVGREGWQSILIVAVANFMAFKALSRR